MQIKGVTITDEELHRAVQEYLLNVFNIRVEVETVEREYSFSTVWQVRIKVEEKKRTPIPAKASVVEEILAPVVIEKSDEDKYIDSLQPDAVRMEATEAP